MTPLALIFQAGGGGSILTTLMPFVLIFGVFYFLIIAPQRKRQKALSDMVSAEEIEQVLRANRADLDAAAKALVKAANAAEDS